MAVRKNFLVHSYYREIILLTVCACKNGCFKSVHGHPIIIMTVYYLCATDYLSENQVLTFSPGQQQLSVPIRIIDDNIVEASEIFSVEISLQFDEANVTIGSPTATIVIRDDDCKQNNKNMRSVSDYSMDSARLI